MSGWLPRMKSEGKPLVNVVSLFRLGMPASAAGVVPKSAGSTSTLYWNQPKRKSTSSDGDTARVDAVGQALVADIRDAGDAHERRAAAADTERRCGRRG